MSRCSRYTDDRFRTRPQAQVPGQRRNVRPIAPEVIRLLAILEEQS